MTAGTLYANARVFLLAHERLVLAVIAGLVLWFAIGKVDTLIANHDNANLQQAKVVAQVQQEKNTALAAQVAQQAAQYKELADKVQTQNAQLEQANVALVAALTKQQKVDATLPPSELVARWNTLVPQAGATVTPNGVTLPSVGAVATVQQLELVPVQQQELVAAQAEVKNDLGLISAGNADIATLNLRIDGLNLQLGDNAKVCQDQIAVFKAEARKKSRRWFLIGYVAGFLSRQYIKTATGF
jgi:hypothetical protein